MITIAHTFTVYSAMKVKVDKLEDISLLNGLSVP